MEPTLTDEVSDWRDFGGEDLESEEAQVDEYDLSSAPNDFNTLTIFNFISSGAVKIPGFQRNYVWDRNRASKLIESLIIGLPVPQVFLYEEGRNSYLVIDGQQRLLTIYFFVKKRFPRRNKRAELRKIFAESHIIPDELLSDDRYFERFSLRLPKITDERPNKFNGLTYDDLDDYRAQFDLRTIRNIIVKQLKPTGDSSIYEMFHRLNSGGVNLRPQEIRASLYFSDLFVMLSRVNLTPDWRMLVSMPDPDVNLRDTEILLRAVAMYCRWDDYGSSMAQFLNNFSKEAKSFDHPRVVALESRLMWFFHQLDPIAESREIFLRSGKFSVTLFEAVFAASARLHDESEGFSITGEAMRRVREDESFQSFAQTQSNKKSNVAGRLNRAYALMR